MLAITERPLNAALAPLVIIDRIIADLELTPQQYKLAQTSYMRVAEVLRSVGSVVFNYYPDIFPQGSIRLGTTVRPIGAERFDLDMVCKLMISGKSETPTSIYNLVWEALGQDEACRKMRERKNRCIRLTPAESTKFYLDVVPAIPDWIHQSSLLWVPDAAKKIWCSSHPISYADDWFKPITEKLPKLIILVMANERRILNASRVERLPDYGEFEKKPLQRIIQLIKHHRNQYFQGNETDRPSSIIITTITAKSYLDTLDKPFENLMDFVISVVEKLPHYVTVNNTPLKTTYEVINPVNELENFAEKWTINNYQKFIEWHAQLCQSLRNLRASNGEGTDVTFNRLKSIFNASDVVNAANSIGVDTQKLHEQGFLRANTYGKVGVATGLVIPKTVYFGK